MPDTATIEQQTIDVSRRLRSIETQLETLIAVAQSMVRGSDEQSIEGRKARHVLATLRDLQIGLQGVEGSDDE